jgi:uncharacterized membrane protein (DUF106 family)
MMSKRNKPAQGRSGGPKTSTYIIFAILAFLVFYVFILPAFTPKSTTTATTSTSTGTGSVSLTPGADIAGTMVTLNGQGLPRNQNVTATFDSKPLNTTGTCFTAPDGSLSGCNFWVPDKPSGSYPVNVTAGTDTIQLRFSIPQYRPPVSTVLVTLTSVSLGFVTQLVTRRVVDLGKERRMNAEVKAFQKEKREAQQANDKVKLDKMKKRELQIAQERAKVSTGRLKVTFITIIPLFVVYYLMASFLGGYSVIVAYTPIPIPIIAAATQVQGTYEVSLLWWYFLSSFTFSTMLTKLLHTAPS